MEKKCKLKPFNLRKNKANMFSVNFTTQLIQNLIMQMNIVLIMQNLSKNIKFLAMKGHIFFYEVCVEKVNFIAHEKC